VKVSILIPTKNRAALLREAITSALNEAATVQNNVEILVSDNASSDDTRQVMQEFGNSIRSYRQESDLGMVGNWNFLMRNAQGEFIKLMGDDDALLQGSLNKELRAIGEDPTLCLVSSARIEGNPPIGGVQSPPETWGGKLKQTYPIRYRLNAEKALREMIYRENIFGTPTSVLFRKSALPSFPENWAYAVDWAGWIEALAHGDALVLPEPNCIFRIHDSNLTKGFVKTDIDLVEVLSLRKLALDRSGGGMSLRIYLLFVSLYRWARRLARKLLVLRAN
jgi:glycosyltransferase involved in cell wall biosynthesis